jgi:hypothetical protein
VHVALVRCWRGCNWSRRSGAEGGGPEEQKQLAEATAKCEALQKAIAELQVQLQQQKESEAAARKAEAAAKDAEEQAKQVPANTACCADDAVGRRRLLQ